MKRPWIYLENPMETATNNSFRLSNRINEYHFTRLKATNSDPFIMELYDNYLSAHDEFFSKYTHWKVAKALQLSKTIDLNKVIRILMSEKIQNWSAQIIVVYGIGTPKYITLLRNGSKPFQNGSIDLRLSAIQTLIISIGSDPALETLKEEIQSFYDSMNNTAKAQQGAKTTVATLSNEMEEARKEMCIKQYENLGSFISKRARETNTIGFFFDLKAMRRRQQVIYVGHVKIKNAKTIAKHTFAEGEEVELENTGLTVLQFYIAAKKNQPPGTDVITLAPGTKKTIAVKQQDSISKPYLMVYNPDEVNKAEFAVEFL